jgi:hypothetical protein
MGFFGFAATCELASSKQRPDVTPTKTATARLVSMRLSLLIPSLFAAMPIVASRLVALSD